MSLSTRTFDVRSAIEKIVKARAAGNKMIAAQLMQDAANESGKGLRWIKDRVYEAEREGGSEGEGGEGTPATAGKGASEERAGPPTPKKTPQQVIAGKQAAKARAARAGN